MPTYREAQSFSSVFILLGMYPLWLVGLLMTDPSGPVAMFSSYFPFSSAMVLLFRNALGEISGMEMLFSTFVLLIYVILSFLISYKLFEIGALEYHQRLSLKTVVDRIRRIKKRE
jgi:ABC-2 type transport system permease protein